MQMSRSPLHILRGFGGRGFSAAERRRPGWAGFGGLVLAGCNCPHRPDGSLGLALARLNRGRTSSDLQVLD
jgi:hypothetical protein